ncbi:MAG TPA: hypothetical protein VFD83_03550, partial [Candidatus Polarisedimenticolia bacterium]|nr:hypothetical protein [Candidatus Polarisedimenticolia bacterium]
AGTALAVIGSWMREFRRTEGFLRQSPREVLRGDLQYAALCCVAVGAEVAMQRKLSAALVLAFVGAAGIVTGLRRFGQAPANGDTLTQLWPQVRWTIPNVVVTWMQGNSFPYFVAMFAGARGVADLSAARLFLMPISLLSVAWARVFQPQAGERLAAAEPESVFAMARSGAAQLFLVGVTYGVLLFGIGALGGWRLLPDRYAGIVGVMVLWWVYFLVSCVRSVATVGLIAHLVFKRLFSFSVLVAVISVPLMLLSGQWLGYEFIIAGMALGEAFLAFLLWSEFGKVSNAPGASRASLECAA